MSDGDSICEKSKYMDTISIIDCNLLLLEYNNVKYFYLVNYMFNLNIIHKNNQINFDYKEFPKLSKKNHLIKCFYHGFNCEQKFEVIETLYSKLLSGIGV